MGFDLSRRRFLTAAAAVPYLPYLRSASAAEPESGKGVIDLTRSPYAKMRTVPIGAVTVGDGFWGKRIKINRDVAIPFTYGLMEDHGRFDNFLRWDGKARALRAGFHTDHPSGLRAGGDSETYKWLEAASYVLDAQRSADFQDTVKTVVADVIGAQEPSGYLNTYFVEGRIPDRMLTVTQVDGHEFYNGGHLLMAAIAYYRATSDRSLLDAGLRYIDDFILPNFGPEPSLKPLISGHPGAEMAIVELYRTSGDQRHLKLAGYVLEGDPRIPLERGGSVLAKRDLSLNSTYLYCGIPFISRTKLAGHAVRCLYACCGAADYYLETGDPAYKKTLETLWQDLVNQKMYITGAVGVPRFESFGDPYELPNLTAYAESCGSIANMMWNWRLLCGSADARFADVIERVLYNAVNAGTSLDGKLYNYCNPLALDPAVPANIRKPWYSTNCCPPNLERTFASIPGYMYSTAKDGIYVHLFDNSELDWRLEDGTGLKLAQKTRYPWDGDVELQVTPAQAADFTVYVRIPGWSKATEVQVDGSPVDGGVAGQYLAIRRRWSGASRITLRFDMTPRVTAANHRVESDRGRIAIERGPLVYCMEQIDQAEAGTLDGFSMALNEHTAQRIEVAFDPQLLGGVVVLRAPGFYEAAPAAPEHSLYRSISGTSTKTVTLKLIPYYTFANRTPSAMQVWIPIARTV